MSDEPPEPPEWLEEAAEALLETAERCYRLARGITDRAVIEKLLELAQECEARAEALGKPE